MESSKLWKYLPSKESLLVTLSGTILLKMVSFQISIFRSQIWNPIVLLYNSASYEKQIETHSTIVLRNDGRVEDVLPMILKSTCKIDVKWFPFDEQKCFLVFGSWTVSSKELRFQFNEDTVVTSELVNFLFTFYVNTLLLFLKE